MIRIAFVFSTLILALCPLASAQELRTYRILENEERFFQFGGGLLDFRIQSKLTGSFDILIEDTGSATITRFDVLLDDLLSTGTHDTGWRDGDSLAERLFQSPIDLSGELTLDPGQEQLTLSIVEEAFANSLLQTTIRLLHSDARIASFNLSSVYLQEIYDSGIGIPLLDVPSMRALSHHNGSQLLVQLVPEPHTLTLGFLSVTVAMLKCRYCEEVLARH